MNVLKEINKLRLDLLDNDWVQGIYFSEFLEFGEFPPEYDSILESLDIRTTFRHIMKAFNVWLNAETDVSNEEKSWAVLSNKIKHEKLLALLAYYMDYGGKNVVTKEHRNNAILASRLYYKLLAVPGYKAYHIYHSQLFAQSLACLSYPKAMCENEDKFMNTKELTHEVNSVIKELQYFVRDLRFIIEPLQLSPCDMNFEDILSNLVDITGGAIVNKLANVDKIELANISRVIYEMIDILVCQANGEPDSAAILLLFKSIFPKLVAASMDCKNANNFVRASYVTYSGLLLTKYGKAALPSYTILLQHLCYNYEGLEKAEVRTARVSLVMGLMSLLPRKPYKKIVNWILTLSTTAKVAHRHIALEMLSKLLTNDPEEEKSTEPETKTTENKTPEDVDQPQQSNDIPANQNLPTNNVTLETETSGSKVDNKTHNAKVNENQEDPSVQASDCKEKSNKLPDCVVLLETETIHNNKTVETDKQTVNEVKDLCALDDETIINQIDVMISGDKPLIDSFPLVTVENLESTSDETSIQPDKEIAEQQQLNNNALGTQEKENAVIKCDKKKKKGKKSTIENQNENIDAMNIDDNSQDTLLDENDELTEEDIAGLLRQRPHTAPYKAIIQAVIARLNDVSSTIRTKALAALTACVISDNKHMQNAITEFLECGRVAAAAGRGAVDERAAVRRAAVPLLRALPPHHDHTQMLVGLCRDASIIVRSASIAAVGDLLLLRPDDSTVDAFLDGPMNQLSDPENKVQEQVTTLIQQVLFDRIEKYTSYDGASPLPWLFLRGIIRRNMRSHLQRACCTLLKSGNCINHRTVDILSTHLGARDEAHDLETLVLLTCVAPHVAYNDVGFVLQYYENLWNSQDRDGRLLPLTLELLTAWSKWIVGDQRTELRDSLIKSIATAADDERRALKSTNMEDWLRAADLSLVASVPPSDELLKLFVKSLTDPPPEWSGAEWGACVVAAGRVCVRSRAAAAAAAPALAALLRPRRAPPQPARNALLALADLATRYTCIAEPLLDDMCACLAVDCDPHLRQTTSRAITKLLLGGYLRLRAGLYYKYVALLSDSDALVRGPAEYYVGSCLPVDAIYHHFVDCILYYNSDKCIEKLSFDSRQLIYDVMLQRMSLVQRLNTQCRLAREIIQHGADVVEESLAGQLPEQLHAALLDTLTVLCGARMKLPTKKQRDGDADDIDDLQERITTNIVSHKMKCTVAEVVVPAVLQLYSRVRSQGGQLVTYLVKVATDLLHHYRAEIEELIENDEELVARVSHFQSTIGAQPSFGNSRNLVTASTGAEPPTPRAQRSPRKRPARAPAALSKRALRM